MYRQYSFLFVSPLIFTFVLLAFFQHGQGVEQSKGINFSINLPEPGNRILQSDMVQQSLVMIPENLGPEIIDKAGYNKNKLGLSYAVGSALLTGTNLLYHSNRSGQPWLFDDPSSNHWFGLAAGSGSLVLGILNIDNNQSYVESIDNDACEGIICPPLRKVKVSNEARTALSIANIGVGVISMIRSGYHLIKKPESSTQQTSLSVTHLEAHPIVLPGEFIPAAQVSVRF